MVTSTLVAINIPVSYDATNCSSVEGDCQYIPKLNRVFMEIRFARKITISSSGIADYILGIIPTEYRPKITTAINVQLFINGTSARTIASWITSNGEIKMRVYSTTNPDYFYVSGSWVVG